MSGFQQTGWQLFDHDSAVADWVNAARPAAIATTTDPEHAHWLRCQGTWFAGVNVLGNDATGAVDGSGPLRGAAVDFALGLMDEIPNWDRAQISVTYPGYPKQENETDAAFGFRLRRDAAHVDGLSRTGPNNRRHLKEPHAFVLGLPMTETGPGASPMVVWEGSHVIMGDAFGAALKDTPPAEWPNVDLTEIYQAARKRCFDTCKRVEIHARPGQAYVIHRLALHGVAPWQPGAVVPPAGRMIAYFRPHLTQIDQWLS